jgi:hypothetical protein
MKTSLLIRNLKSVFPERPSHRTLCALVAGLLLGAVSCSHPLSSGTSKKAPPPPFEIEDPIISMMMASSIDAKGELVNPRFSFPQTTPQITAIVQVGNVKGSQLTLTWYKTSDDGDEKLFEHQIQVKSHERAFSVAKKPGRVFSAGTYKVVATLDGQTLNIMQTHQLLDELEREADGRRKTRAAETHARNGAATRTIARDARVQTLNAAASVHRRKLI